MVQPAFPSSNSAMLTPSASMSICSFCFYFSEVAVPQFEHVESTWLSAFGSIHSSSASSSSATSSSRFGSTDSSRRASGGALMERTQLVTSDLPSAEHSVGPPLDHSGCVTKIHLPNGSRPVVGLSCLHLLNFVKVLLRTTPQVRNDE